VTFHAILTDALAPSRAIGRLNLRRLLDQPATGGLPARHRRPAHERSGRHCVGMLTTTGTRARTSRADDSCQLAQCLPRPALFISRWLGAARTLGQ